MNSREDSHNFWTTSINLNSRTQSIHEISTVIRLQFPRSWSHGVRLLMDTKKREKLFLEDYYYSVGESTDRAHINQVSRQFACDHLFNVSSYFGWSSSAGGTQVFKPSNLATSIVSVIFLQNEIYLFGESHTTSAVNASCHDCWDERTDILVLNGAFVFIESTDFVAIHLRDVLKIALSTLFLVKKKSD